MKEDNTTPDSVKAANWDKLEPNKKLMAFYGGESKFIENALRSEIAERDKRIEELEAKINECKRYLPYSHKDRQP